MEVKDELPQKRFSNVVLLLLLILLSGCSPAFTIIITIEPDIVQLGESVTIIVEPQTNNELADMMIVIRRNGDENQHSESFHVNPGENLIYTPSKAGEYMVQAFAVTKSGQSGQAHLLLLLHVKSRLRLLLLFVIDLKI
jgi:hypothetical protein